MPNSQKGFTLIELMIVVAIIAILASLAVSAYQTYTVRAQVAEGLSFAGGAKVPVVEAFNNTGIPPADLDAAGMPPNASDIQGSYVSGVSVSNGRIDSIEVASELMTVAAENVTFTGDNRMISTYVWEGPLELVLERMTLVNATPGGPSYLEASNVGFIARASLNDAGDRLDMDASY